MDGMHGMGGMSPSPSSTNGTSGMMRRHKMMMHMTFFWGTNAEVLFSHWPGKSTGMYVLALFFTFALSFLVEYLSHCRLVGPGASDVAAGLVQTFLFAVRIGLAYMVMLAVMSFNGGVFLAAIAGHTLGFLIFGSRVFKKQEAGKESDLPRLSCC
jgi:copper transporter 1